MGCGFVDNQKRKTGINLENTNNSQKKKKQNIKGNEMVKITEKPKSGNNKKNPNIQVKKKINNCICNIKTNEINKIGFFCIIPFIDSNNLPVLITNYIFFKNDELKLFTLNIDCFSEILLQKKSNNNKVVFKLKINNSRKIYINEKLNISIIEIKKDEDNLNILQFMKIDENIFDENPNSIYKEKEVYFQNENQGNIKCKIRCINENNDIELLCKNNSDFSGSPIFLNDKIIGIYKGNDGSDDIKKEKEYSLGLFIKDPIIEFYDKYNNINEIKIIYKFIKKTPSKNLKQLRNNILKRKLFNEKFVENNKKNCKIIYNEKEYDLTSDIFRDLVTDKRETIEIKLKGINKITNMSYMFSGCSTLLSVDDLSKLNTYKITDMNHMFYACESLSSLPDMSKWDVRKVKDISYMFDECIKLEFLPDISQWKTNNVKNMSHIFENCFNLLTLPDISKWNTDSVIDMSFMFHFCSSLKYLPDISKWNIEKVTNINNMFYCCSSLQYLPDISKWNTRNIKDMSGLFSQCLSLSFIPDISKWNTINVLDISEIFCGCISLTSLPDISQWKNTNLNRYEYIFHNCLSLSYIPNIYKWNLNFNTKKILAECFNVINIEL